MLLQFALDSGDRGGRVCLCLLDPNVAVRVVRFFVHVLVPVFGFQRTFLLGVLLSPFFQTWLRPRLYWFDGKELLLLFLLLPFFFFLPLLLLFHHHHHLFIVVEKLFPCWFQPRLYWVDAKGDNDEWDEERGGNSD
jgi:hypothetical protein